MDENQMLLKQVFPSRSRGWKFRIVVPVSLRNAIMFNYHDRVYSGHFAISKTLWKIQQLFTWDTMYMDIVNYIKSCEKCQRRNVIHTKAPFQPISPPSYPMQRLNIDLLGPFNRTKNNNRYLIVYTEGLSRMIFASPIPNMEAQTVAQNYLENVFSLHGGSLELVTDRGPQFTGAIFESLCKKLGVRHITTSSYHPCSNGIAERANGKILNTLAQVCNKNYDNWDLVIHHCIFALNVSPHRSAGESPFFIFHSFDPIDPMIEASATFRQRYAKIPDYIEQIGAEMELAREEVTLRLMTSSQNNCRARNEGRKLNEFRVGQLVLYLDATSYTGKNRKLKPRYKGPYRVTERTGLVNYKIRNVSIPSDIKSAHVDKLKCYFPRYLVMDENTDVRINKTILNKQIVDTPSSTDNEEEDHVFILHQRNTNEGSEKVQTQNEVNNGRQMDVSLQDKNESANIDDVINIDDEKLELTQQVYEDGGRETPSEESTSRHDAPTPSQNDKSVQEVPRYNLRKNIVKPIRFR